MVSEIWQRLVSHWGLRVCDEEAVELTQQRIRDLGPAGLVDLLGQFEEEYRRSM